MITIRNIIPQRIFRQISGNNLRSGSVPNAGLQKDLLKRYLATSFADMYRESPDSAPIIRGDLFQGRIVGTRRPRATTSRFYIVDFGFKSEAPFTPHEIPGSSVVGDKVSMAIMTLEDDFNEPVFDHDRRSELSTLQAQRYELLAKAATDNFRFLHGRFAGFKRGGASIKTLGSDSFSPRHHVVSFDHPILGSYAPFYVMSVSTRKKVGDMVGLDVNPVVSSYGGFLFCLANLVGLDSAWEKSGNGSPKERLAYLRLLTRLLTHKNSAVRRILPKNTSRNSTYRMRNGDRNTAYRQLPNNETAWLKDLPRRTWNSKDSRKTDSTNGWRQRRPPVKQKVTFNSGQPSSTNKIRDRHSRTDSRPTRSVTRDTSLESDSK